jgi:hypothetical protein
MNELVSVQLTTGEVKRIDGLCLRSETFGNGLWIAFEGVKTCPSMKIATPRLAVMCCTTFRV